MGFLSAIANVGSSLLGGYIDNYYNRKAAKQQYEYQMAMWNANNAYNTPAEQMKRLREAGLNPNLIYGGGSATHTATMASVPRVEPGRSGLNADTILKYQQSEIFNQELLNLQETRKLIQAQVASTKAGTKSTDISNTRGQMDLDVYRNTGVDPTKSMTSLSAYGNLTKSVKGIFQDIGAYIGDKVYQIFGDPNRVKAHADKRREFKKFMNKLGV